jgi:hypothetical protein
MAEIIKMDDIMLKLSIHEVNVNSSNDSLENETNQFFNQITQQLENMVETYTDELNQKIKTLLFADNETEREENKLELITVFSIIKTIKHIDSLLVDPLNSDSARKINTLLLSFISLFKYHFQLPNDHNNYSLKNFGILISSSKLNVFNSFIKFMNLSSNSYNELNKSETLEKSFTLLLVLHCFNHDLFIFLIEYLSNPNTIKDIFYNFNLNTISKSTYSSIQTIFNVMQIFKMALLLEDSTLVSDKKSNNLLNIIFYSSFHKFFLSELIVNIIKINNIFTNELHSNILLEISNEVLLSQNFLDILTLFVIENLRYFDNLDDFVKSENPNDYKSRDLSMFLLLKISTNYILNYNIFLIPNKDLLSYLIEYNNSNYISILGISEENEQCELNITTLLPIFEIVDQNIKLDYLKERDFLTNFKLSLITLDLNLESNEDFMNLNSLLVDIGSSLSIHALVDTIQTLLCILINNIKFNSTIFNKIPNDFQKILGFEFIPPVYRSDMSFQNNIDLQAENYGSTFKALQEIENYSTIKQSKSISLLEDCLILILSIKSKILKFLKDLNMDTNVLRLPDLFSTENNIDEYPLNIFKQGITTKIGSFKSSKSLNYKLLNSSISLNIISNLILLSVSENYKLLKSSDFLIDNSISRLLNEFTFDFSLNFFLIYQEFGMLNFFKKIRDLNNENLKLILPSAILISKLFQTKITDLKPESNNSNIDNKPNLNLSSNSASIQNSNLDLISEMLYRSVIASNLLRQFVEIFDDGQSKPFKSLNKFLKSHPSTLKPSKIAKGTITLDFNYYSQALV